MGRGLLVAAFDFSTAHADEFDDWYDLEHRQQRFFTATHDTVVGQQYASLMERR